MAKFLALMRHYPLYHDTNNPNYVDIPSNYWAFQYIEALYDNFVTANPGSYFVPSRLATRGYASFYSANSIVAPHLAQGIAHQQSPYGYIYVEVQKSAPLRNTNVDKQGHSAAGPVSITDFAGTFVESGPASNPVDDTYGNNIPGLHSYTSSSAGNQYVDRTVFLRPLTTYFYYSQYTPVPNPPHPDIMDWTAAACDPGCGFSTIYNLGVSSLPYIGSNAETFPEAENLGTTAGDYALYEVVNDNNTHPWCYNSSLLYNTAGATFSQNCGYPQYYYDINWTHD